MPQERRFRLIWADKLAAGAAAVFVALFVFMEALFLLVAGVGGAKNLLGYLGFGTLEYSLLLIAAFWLVLRGFDALFGGSTREVLRRPRASRSATPHGAMPV